MPLGTSAYEKRGIAINVPKAEWEKTGGQVDGQRCLVEREIAEVLFSFFGVFEYFYILFTETTIRVLC